MKSNQELVDYLIRSGVLSTPVVIKAFRAVDRGNFVRPDYLDQAYGDYPLPIGAGQTISQPTTVAIMLELLQPQRGEKVLDVGSGSAWTTALLSEIVGSKGQVVGVEIVPELVLFGKKNLGKYDFPQTKIKQAEKGLGWPEEGPYDRILVSAAGSEWPTELVDQLKISGRMVIPILGSVWQIIKTSKDSFKQHEYPGFVFVPLKEPEDG
jgi:protein-L-isoaspartate(D-aspartate) O-methyltransferase